MATAAGEPRAELDGPPVELTPQAVQAAQALSMAVYELATNATKHGALSLPGGHVVLSWRLDPAAGELHLRWAEAGGLPLAGQPARRGFGSRVIETTVRGQLGGTLTREWAPTGLVCEVAVPLARTVGCNGSSHAA